ncbi:MAG: Protein containing transglutaminase-like domain, putative cysteine protease [uncultured Ramlibacter sp.]|uniref:Protein containing transglutaminase-like domain, putative cysteine protease n=1 Tax=uncultured Ramlibacter sp. TaxID=260755 RepID=A0A6J4P5S0_9BURK|nr:MAG: Protein containing transglutaminase-like domain, putative cysteine protease [uncultured Ramlibacter sp.]
MLLHVVHETSYRYAPAVKTAQHMAHLRPAHGAGQELLRHELTIEPAPSQRTEAVDVFGNTRCFFGLQSAHEQLRVVADSLVRTHAPPAPQGDLPWEQARERLRFHRGAAYDPAAEFLFASPYVPRHEDFAAYARASFTPGRAVVDAARDLMHRIHADFTYESAATDANTPALQALALRKGVCQDFAHVMIGCLRSLGLPARYVSGYLLTEPPPGQTRLVGSDASHAWASVYLPAPNGPGEWADLDPTNDRAPGEDYVTVAVGRDYADVSPVRGVLHGGSHHTLRVAVTVNPVALEDAPTIAPDPNRKDLP